jgi:hypothetical protein
MFEWNLDRKNRALIETLEPRTLFASIISGMVYMEQDADGLRGPKERGLAHTRVYLDSNVDGKWQSSEASIFTDSKGRYSFTAQKSGVYRVRVVVGKGLRQTSQSYYDISASGNDIHVANDFGLTRTAVVRGVVFDDVNGDGQRQTSERGMAGVRIYIDKNNNGKFDKKERTRLTDGDGEWGFSGLQAGKYRIRVVASDDAKVTSPSRGFLLLKLKPAQTLSNRSFALA